MKIGRCVLLPAALGLVLSRQDAAAAHRPKRLIVCNDVAPPPTLDAHKEFSQKNHIINQQIFEGLVRFDPEGRVEPALAVSWERLSPLKVRFQLRKGVRFHNGEPFDAQAARFSISRLLDPKTGFPGRGLFDSIGKVSVIDTQTIDIETTRPDGLLLNRLAWGLLIVPPRYLGEVGEERFAREPVGTGAFRFGSRDLSRRIVLDANREYWMSGYPKIDQLVFAFIEKPRQIEALFNGEINLLFDVPGTQTQAVQARRDTKVLKAKIFYTLAPSLRFNRGPLGSRDVRRALNYGVDKDSLIRYDLLGNGIPIATLSMPGEPGHDPELKPYPYDPQKAKALLKRAGYPHGFELSAMVNENALRPAKIIAANLQDIGVRFHISTMTESQLGAYFSNPIFDLAVGDVPDTMAHSYFLQALVIYSKSPFSLAKDEKFDGMLEQMTATIDESERDRLARALDRYVHDEALSIFTYQRLQTCGVRRGVDFHSYVTGMPYFYAAEVHEDR
ncbi:MAG TPA: hypothetical protein DCZ01_10695 [Elusimicrobia bacterium]|nr:MAG: hypothetical protein A2X37_11805 [Elusimicrobia bacterium GWA2_66_18]OGR71750.1 MAG: hypothetical protein A2X40_11170 [Elusimicrobia bacterium GWC2_65_9]HAZ08960.1 hypothetical protein [Elusimicrobiota bacterium]